MASLFQIATDSKSFTRLLINPIVSMLSKQKVTIDDLFLPEERLLADEHKNIDISDTDSVIAVKITPQTFSYIDELENVSDSVSRFFPVLYEKKLKAIVSAKNISTLFTSNNNVFLYYFNNGELKYLVDCDTHRNWHGTNSSVILSHLRGIAKFSLLEEKLLADFFNKVPHMALTSYSAVSANAFYNPVKRDTQFYLSANELILGSFLFDLDQNKTSVILKRLHSYKENEGNINKLSYLYGDPKISDNFGILQYDIYYKNDFLDYKIPFIVVNSDFKQLSITVELSNLDKDFIESLLPVVTTKPKDFYSSYKTFSYTDDFMIKNCNSIYNHNKSVKVLVKTEKKNSEHTKAFNTKMFNDYLGYAISLVAIPLFQSEFVIPEHLNSKYAFSMAPKKFTLVRNQYNKHNKIIPVNTVIHNSHEFPDITSAVSNFCEGYRKKTIKNVSSANPSLFTRYFVTPFLDVSVCKTAYISWLTSLDSEFWSKTFLRKQTSGIFGLLSDKTFGVKNILNHIFLVSDEEACTFWYSSSERCSLSMNSTDSGFKELVEIAEANFSLTTEYIEQLRSCEYISSTYTLHINRLLFLSPESLSIFNELYLCKTFDQLNTVLEKHIPYLLEIATTCLEEHVISNLQDSYKYFMHVIKTLSKELENDSVATTKNTAAE